jgi:hypothetical protein
MTADVIDLATRRQPPAGPTDSDIRFAKEAARQRLRLTKDQDYLLATLQPAVTADWLKTSEVIAYFRVSPKVVHYMTHAHRTELQAVGFERGAGGAGNESRFSRRAVLHMALVMREGTSERADVIKRALGAWTGRPSTRQQHVGIPDHERASRELLRHAKRIAEDTQDGDPTAVWDALSGMDRHDLQGVTVALAALLPLDQHGLHKYLTQVGLQHLRDTDQPVHPSRAAAAGLAALIPEGTQNV